MNRLSSLIRWDILLQYRYGFYYATFFMVALWIVILRQIPENIKVLLLPMILLFDITIFGFYFIAGLVLFEKGERILEGLVVTPLKAKEYLISKMITLTILALMASITLVIFVYGLNFNKILFTLSIMLSSFFFVLLGFIAVARINSINIFLVRSVVYLFIFNLPLLDFYGIFEFPLFYLIPTQASLILLGTSFSKISYLEAIYSFSYIILSIIVAYILGYRSFYKHFILRQGVE